MEAVNLQVEPSSVIAEPIQVQATLTPSTTTEELTTPKPKGPRQPKLMVLEPEPVVIEASEVEPVQVQETLTREEEEGQQEEEEHHGAILATPVQQEEQARARNISFSRSTKAKLISLSFSPDSNSSERGRFSAQLIRRVHRRKFPRREGKLWRRGGGGL